MLDKIKSLPKKYMLLGIIAVVVLGVSAISFGREVQLVLNGIPIATEVAPVKEKNTTLVPIRIISEGLGASVDYVSGADTITIKKDNTELLLTIGSTEVIANGIKEILPVAPKKAKGTTLVPVRFVSQYLGCTVDWDSNANAVRITSPQVATDITLPIATFNIKGIGEVQAELYPQYAPNTVANFISLANDGFYDGLIFHRVIKNFMIQGGDPQGTGTGGPGYSIPGEFAQNGFANPILHTPGVLSMARSGHPDSAGSQFFVMTSDSPHLDGAYAGFGKVTQGLEKIMAIQDVATNRSDRPMEDVVIESIRVETFGEDYSQVNKVN